MCGIPIALYSDRRFSNMTTLSVVTVVKNNPAGMDLTLRSLLYIPKSSYEHIVIDGSQDTRTKEVCVKFFDRIDKYVQNSDSGIFDAMNKSLRFCTREYLTFLNSGDQATQDFWSLIDLSHQLINCDIIYSNVLLSGRIADKVYYPRFKIENLVQYYQRMPFPHPGLLVKRSLFESYGGFRLDRPFTADHEWIVRVLKNPLKIASSGLTPVKFGLDGKSNSLSAHVEMIRTALDNEVPLTIIVINFFRGFLAFLKYKYLGK
jgi:glycosyltransferase involved in cell wall biosynthesis